MLYLVIQELLLKYVQARAVLGKIKKEETTSKELTRKGMKDRKTLEEHLQFCKTIAQAPVTEIFTMESSILIKVHICE